MGNNNEKASGYEHEYYIRLKEMVSRMNTHEMRVSLKTARMLQQAGFDWECECAILPTTEMGDMPYPYNHGRSHNYNDKDKYPFEIYSAPTLDVAQRWLREVKGIEVYAHVFYDTYDTSEGWDVYVYEANHITKQIEDWIKSYDVYHSYEEAQEAGIQKCLTILLEEKENEKINIM